MKASTIRQVSVSNTTPYDEILSSKTEKKPLKLKGRKKRNDVSRFSLDAKFEKRPLYKAEVIIDKFLND